RLLGRSPNSASGDLPRGWREASGDPEIASRRDRPGDPPWRQKQRRIEPHPAIAPRPEPEDARQAALSLTAGRPLKPAHAALRSLVAPVAGLSAGLWLVAACLGHLVCRRALSPLTRMAATAREMTATDLDRRLPSPGTGDELEALGDDFNDL